MAKSANVSAKKTCFVVGPIGKDGSEERKHSDLLLNAVIKAVLGSEDFGYVVKRADEDADPGMIGDRIVTDILNSDLVVADLTGLNPNVFYELGIRHSTQKPTIHMAKVGTNLPFDNIAHRTIFIDLLDWHNQEASRLKLAEFTRTIEQPGYAVSNPITQAGASFKMRTSEDPAERVLASVLERMSRLEKSLDGRRPSGSRDAGTSRSLQLDAFISDVLRYLRNPLPEIDIHDAIFDIANEHSMPINTIRGREEDLSLLSENWKIDFQTSKDGIISYSVTMA